jgi:hypothetical protein
LIVCSTNPLCEEFSLLLMPFYICLCRAGGTLDDLAFLGTLILVP